MDLLVPFAPVAQSDTPTPTPSPSPSPTSTATDTPSPTATATATVPAATATSTPTQTPTAPAAATATSTPTQTATAPAAATSTSTPTKTATAPAAATATSTPTQTATAPAAATATSTPTQAATATSLPATATPTATPVGLPAPPPLNVIVYNRLAFGARAGEMEAFNSLPGTSLEKLTAWIDQQLNPGPDDQDADYWSRRAAPNHNLYTLTKPLTQLWADHWKKPNNANPRWRPAKDVVIDTILRATYSKWQLREVLADFWHNHFNIYVYEGYAEAVWPDWNANVVRKNVLGNFRTFVEDVSKHPAMLFYLDNYINTRSGPNENWARELLELHTMGAENYAGPVQHNQVPKLPDPDPRAAGYCDLDVYSAAALCFTGWGVNDSGEASTGVFEYTDTQHDNLSTKNFLNVFIQPNQEPLDDGLIVLDILAGRPQARVRTDGAVERQRPPLTPHLGVATYICRKLARRLISDNPPQALVDAAVQVFISQHQAADQLKQVVRAMLLWSPTPGGTPLFATTWGEKIKRPFEITISMMRAVNAELKLQNFVPASSNDGTPVPARWDEEDEFFWYYNPMGQPIFQWHPPNGYPDRKEAWKSTTSMLVRWKFANWLAEAGTDSKRDNIKVDYAAQNGGNNTANAIADFWINRILGRPMRPEDRTEVVRFMQGSYGPSAVLPAAEINARLKYMVSLILSSPDYSFR